VAVGWGGAEVGVFEAVGLAVGVKVFVLVGVGVTDGTEVGGDGDGVLVGVGVIAVVRFVVGVDDCVPVELIVEMVAGDELGCGEDCVGVATSEEVAGRFCAGLTGAAAKTGVSR